MSEAAPAAGREEIWIEKYRPQRLDEIVGHEEITARLKSYVEQDDLPHLLMSGPAGVGKCVTGETPVLTNHGIERIENVVGDVDGFESPDDGLEVLTFEDNDGFRYVEPTAVFGKATDKLVSVRTRDGADMTVTPEHKLLVLGHDGLEWKPADSLATGDRIVRPRSTPLPEGDGKLDWMTAMDDDRTLVHVTDEFAKEYGIPAEEYHIGTRKSVLAGIREELDNEELARDAGVTEGTIRMHRRELADVDFDEPSTVCSLSYLRDLEVSRAELKCHVKKIQYVTQNNRRSEPITPPWSVTPSLATFIGLAVSEASLDGKIKFFNTDDGLLEQFEDAARTVFDVEPRTGKQKGVPYRAIGNRTLLHFLESSFDVFARASGGEGIGSTMLSADRDSRAAFLRAVFDAEAYIDSHGMIELTQKNDDLITLLSYLLSGIGVPSRRKTKQKAATNGSGREREYHVLYISGAHNLAKFQEIVGFTIDRKTDQLTTNAAKTANPNDDTIPVQRAVDELCETLYLPKSKLTSETLHPDSPGRENYCEDIDRVLKAANEKIEAAQRVLEELDRMETLIDDIAAVPATWIATRDSLSPITIRNELSETTGIRSDRLLEYSDGRRTPTAQRVGDLLIGLEAIDQRPATETVQTQLKEAIQTLDIPYAHVATGTELYGGDVGNLLNNDDHDLISLSKFAVVADRVRDIAAGMLTSDVLESLHTLDVLVSTELYYDEVTQIEQINEERRVYDLTVPESRNYVAGAVPTVMHNTTGAIAIARELYGEDWEDNFLELNASDERGIDVVRDRIKNFARSNFGGYDYRIIFLDEADALTSDAQSALRRTMEQFSSNTRFILSCNYSSQIIDPIQSRCAVFRFSPLDDEAVAEQIRYIAEQEDIETTDDGIDALVYAADGDMRKAINALQAAAVMGETVDEEAVYTITSTAHPEEIETMVTNALEGDFTAARTILDDLLAQGLAGGDVIDQLHRSVWNFDLDDEAAVRLMDRVGEADYRIAEGANERVQLEALLAAVALDDQ